MKPHTRAILAASTFAAVTGKKVAGLYDHSAGRNLKIAAECRGTTVLGYDGERDARFGGELPELYDAGDESHTSLEIEGETARGHDRQTSSDYSVRIEAGLVQLYDYEGNAWFAFDIQGPETGETYVRQS